ncbi:MAG: hypothetical protein PHU33_17035, partial [Bacteroidales bacterium]|nr:hypothetical protein [Bacteroidales bacterium]
MKKILFLVFCLTCGFSLWGQTWQLGWQNCFGGTKEDYATDVVYFNHGYYMLGRTQSIDGDISFFHGGPDDVWLVRTDSTGNMLWEKTYGGSESEDSKRIFESTDGNLYILAGTNSTDGDITNNPFPMTPAYWFLKIDTTGNILWEKTLGGSGGDFETYATPTSDGGIVAIGYSNSSDGDVSVHYGAYDMWMVKLNAQGEKQWDFTLGNEDFDFPYAVIQTSDGGFLVGGSSAFTQGGNLSCNQHGKADAVVVKLDSLRNIEWTQCYGGSDYDGVTRLIEVADGYVFGGYTMSDDGQVTGWHGGDDIWIVKIDFQGSIVWQKCLGGTRNEYIKNISKESDGSYVLFGITQSYDGDVSGNHNIVPEVYDIWMVKLSSEGELISQQCIGGIGDDKLEFGVVQRKDGNYVAAGQMTNGPSYDVLCTPYSTPIPDYWLFELKDCTHYAPLTPSQPTGPTHACSASGEPARYTVPSLANQTHAW